MEWLWLLTTVQERIPRTLVDPTCIFKCTLKDALTPKNGDILSSTRRLRETRIVDLYPRSLRISDLFIEEFPWVFNSVLSKAEHFKVTFTMSS